jgi:hypothetical protein
VLHKFVEKFCNFDRLMRVARRADLICAGGIGDHFSFFNVRRASSEQADTSWRARFGFQPGLQGAAHSQHTANKRAAFDPAPLVRGGRKPRQSKQGLVA